MIATQDKIKVSRSAKQDTVGATIWNHQEMNEITINAGYEWMEATQQWTSLREFHGSKILHLHCHVILSELLCTTPVLGSI